ncbi:MAG: ABC transporter permease [Saprospirales bacterium]|nr:MAG: ABC transporter permease [Saprospirales bacterium]
MGKYLLKRIMLFLPTLFVISLVVFGFSRLMPGDPAERLTGIVDFDGDPTLEFALQTHYERTYRQLGLNLPGFYFSIRPAAINADLSLVYNPEDRKSLILLMYETGEPDQVMSHYLLARQLISNYRQSKADCTAAISEKIDLLTLSSLSSIDQIHSARINLSEATLESACPTASISNEWLNVAGTLTESQRGALWWMPVIRWNGTENQYHKWLQNIASGHWGYSLRDGRSVGSKISGALDYTLRISFWSIVLTFLLGIPIGLFLGISENQSAKRILRSIIYAFYALPLFWLATLCVIFFTTDEYGTWTNLFASPGQIMLSTADGGLNMWNSLSYLLLPVLCLTSGGVAFVARQMEQSAGRELNKRYILMSKAKGNTSIRTTLYHLFPNAAFPIITLLGALVSSLVSGVVIIEVIFNIPGMGRLLWDSIFGQDWNTLVAILLIGGILTLIGQLLADILYARFNPKVRYD